MADLAKSGNDDTGGVNPRLFLPVPGQSTKEVAAGSVYPAMQGMALWFSVMWPQRRVRAVPCLILAGLALMQGTLRRCGHPVPPSRLP